MDQDMNLDLARLDVSLARLSLLVTEAVEYRCIHVGFLAHRLSIAIYADCLTMGAGAVYGMVQVDVAMSRLRAAEVVAQDARVVDKTDLPTILERP